MTSSLYKNDDYTQEALALIEETRSAMTPIIKKWVQAGFSFREVAHLMHSAVFEVELDEAMDRKFPKHRTSLGA